MTDEELKQLVAANAKAIGELRESINNLRDTIADRERPTIQPESKEIDSWCNYLALHDRVQVLERWKHKLERESDKGA